MGSEGGVQVSTCRAVQTGAVTPKFTQFTFLPGFSLSDHQALEATFFPQIGEHIGEHPDYSSLTDQFVSSLSEGVFGHQRRTANPDHVLCAN